MDKSLLNDIGTNWRAEDCRQRMSRPTGRPIRRDDANSRAGNHLRSVYDNVGSVFNLPLIQCQFHQLAPNS